MGASAKSSFSQSEDCITEEYTGRHLVEQGVYVSACEASGCFSPRQAVSSVATMAIALVSSDVRLHILSRRKGIHMMFFSHSSENFNALISWVSCCIDFFFFFLVEYSVSDPLFDPCIPA